MRGLIAALLMSICGLAFAGPLEEREIALRQHQATYGNNLEALNDADFVRRCELALQLLETRLSSYDAAYLKNLYQPWRSTLQNPQLQARLTRLVAQKGGELPGRAAALVRRVAQLPASPPQAEKPVGPLVNPGTFPGSGSAASAGASATASKRNLDTDTFGTRGNSAADAIRYDAKRK